MSLKYVEYLEAIDEASYIDTGISQNSTTVENRRYEYSMMWYNIGVDGIPAGISQNTWNQLIGLYANGGNVNSPVFSGNCGVGNLNSYEKLSASVNVKYDIIMDYKNGYAEIKQGDDIIYTSNEFVKGENNYPKCTLRIFIGKDNNTGTPQYYINGRIYYFKVYDNEELIQDLRPCLDNNNTPCMYDTVTETYYYNQGTGTFKYGKLLDALYLFANNNQGTAENLGSYRLYNMKIDGDSEGVESGVDYVDCLIGDGASYIDTGMAIPSGYKVEVTFMSTVQKAEYISNDWCAIFGCSNAIGFTYDTQPYGMSVGLYSTNIAIKNNGQTNLQYANIKDTCYNKKYILSLVAGENNTNPSNILVFANNSLKQSGQINPYPFAHNYLKIYDFKIYNAQGDLIQHLKPCLDTEGIPCMYDEVSGEYFHNQGSGTFGYKKKLRDFQPVLDSNGIPTLMDKVNKKYYYDKNGNGFRYEESYKPVNYLRSDGYSWINTGIIPTTNTKVVVDTYMLLSDLNNGPALFGSTQAFLSFTFQTTVSWLYVGKINGKHSVGLAGHDFTGRHTITIDLSDMTNIVNIDGTNYGTFTGTQATDSKSIYLWNMFDSWGALGNSGGTAKIYSFKIYENNVLTMDLIPVLDNEETPCMYDLVTETFFYNQGTGEFSYGIEEDECPKVANAIDYINKIDRNNSDYFRTKNFNGLINENLIIKTKIALGSIRDNNGVYFQIVGQYNMNRLYLGYQKNNNQLDYAFFGANDSVTLTDYDVFNDEVWEIELSKNGLTVNGVFIKSLESDITGTSLVVPLYIFQSVTYQDKVNGNILPEQKIYELIFEQDGQIIANFQPCLDDNGNLCFCDIVDNTYYYPTLGTSYGYNQLLQTPIKYIETNGTQYIDTGVVPTDNTDIDMVARAVGETPLYLMNELIIDTTYKYNEIDTTVEPNLTASAGATLTLGSTYSAFLTETEIEQAINNGWTIE